MMLEFTLKQQSQNLFYTELVYQLLVFLLYLDITFGSNMFFDLEQEYSNEVFTKRFPWLRLTLKLCKHYTKSIYYDY